MNKLMAGILSLTLIVGCKCPFCDRDESERPLKVLMIGNSFSVSCMKQLPRVAQELGIKLDLTSMNIGGCSLQRHWNNCVNPEPGFHPYYYSRNTCGVFSDAHYNLPMVLKQERWDIITIQQCSAHSWDPQTYQPYADNLIGLIRKLAPDAQICVQETWAYGHGEKLFQQWGFDQQGMYSRLRQAYAALAKKHGLEVIRTGTAVQEWRKRLPVDTTVYATLPYGGDVTGKIGWKGKTDLHHLNDRGEFLQALVWAAKLLDADLTQLGYHPGCVTDEEAKLMAKIAMEVK